MSSTSRRSIQIRHRVGIVASLSAWCLLPFATAAAQSPWPIGRSTHAMVWHDGLGEALLLGGVAMTQDSALWGWNGARWMAHAAGGPAGRAHFAMSYDAGRDRVVVHGGFEAVFGRNNPAVFTGTWEWDRRAWRRMVPDGADPGPRDHHAMTYDAARRVNVMFGGTDLRRVPRRALDETWTWDGRHWRKLDVPGPPGRSTHRMVYDSRRQRIVTFGGWGATDTLLNDTWSWDGARWTQLASSGPSPRFASRMAYDAARDRIVLFGGRTAQGSVGDTWEFDGERWTEVRVAGPPARNVHAMVYDATRRVVLLFGGFEAPTRFDDLWAFDGVRWTRYVPR